MLIFEDLVIVLFLVFIVFLVLNLVDVKYIMDWMFIGIVFVVVVGLIILGKWLMNFLFCFIFKVCVREMMIVVVLFVVFGVVLIMELGGLLMVMGVFVVGVMFLELLFCYELEVDIELFRGLLFGFFFMGVGMLLDLSFVFNYFFLLFGIVCFYILGKGLVVYFVVCLICL